MHLFSRSKSALSHGGKISGQGLSGKIGPGIGPSIGSSIGPGITTGGII